MNTIVISPYQSPFSDLTSSELLEELWEEGIDWQFKPHFSWFKKSGARSFTGNHVRNYVFSNLRIQMKPTRPKIFGFLHPIDLYHAIRATKALRHFLLDKNFTAVWKESFTNHPDIPMYPDDVSAPKWACLIFGPATCDACGKESCLVEYAFRRRRCDCWASDRLPFNDENIANTIQPIIGEFDHQLDNLWNISMKTYHDQRFFPPQYREKYRCSLKEVTERAHEMRKYLLDIRSGTPDAEAHYQTFLSITGAAVRERVDHSIRCDLWAWDIRENGRVTFRDSIPTLKAKGEKALLKQGHDPRDVKAAQKLIYFNYLDSTSSRSIFRKIKSILEECKRCRLLYEHDKRVAERKKRIIAIFWKNVTFLTRDKKPYLPDPAHLYSHQIFADYIHDSKQSVGELDASSAQQEILHFIKTFWATKKRRLLTILLETGFLPKEATEDSNPDDFLGLAMAVFECCRYYIFFGWEDAGVHIESCSKKIDRAYQALKNLAELLHLDLRFVLAKDLDTLNKRFICKMCEFSWQAGRDLEAMTWRECLNHAKKNVWPKDPHHDHVVFDVLSEALTVSILAIEQPPFPLSAEANWTCQHCNIWFQPVKRAEVGTHCARVVHAITKPIKGVDFVYCQFVLRCPSSRHRLWKPCDLFAHISDKHGIQSRNLVEDVDWIKIKAVEDNSWIERGVRAKVAQNLRLRRAWGVRKESFALAGKYPTPSSHRP
ncbi:hypothetical protein BJ912DRAFT_1044602 [Pholiota molesta]|nr:hypothetical protein BJ912DRAFT_1044602 [Pholiota molesta]